MKKIRFKLRKVLRTFGLLFSAMSALFFAIFTILGFVDCIVKTVAAQAQRSLLSMWPGSFALTIVFIVLTVIFQTMTSEEKD